MPATRIIPRPLAITTDEKLCPAIILTPSSPLDQTDYQILVIPTPQQRKPSRFAWLTSWRAQPIQLPTTAESPLYPITVIHPAAEKRRRARLVLLLAIPLILLFVHLLLAMMQLSAAGYHPETGPSTSIWDPIARLLGFAQPEHVHAFGDQPVLLAPVPELSLD